MPVYTTLTSPTGYFTESETATAISDALDAYTLSNVDPLLKVATVTVTAAQIKTLNASPKQLIAAPGEGKTIVPVKVLFRFNWVGVQYADGSALSVIYAGGSTNLMAGTLAATFITAPTEAVTDDAILGALGTQLAASQNTAVQLKAATTEFATGDGTLTVVIWYHVV